MSAEDDRIVEEAIRLEEENVEEVGTVGGEEAELDREESVTVEKGEDEEKVIGGAEDEIVDEIIEEVEIVQPEEEIVIE